MVFSALTVHDINQYKSNAMAYYFIVTARWNGSVRWQQSHWEKLQLNHKLRNNITIFFHYYFFLVFFQISSTYVKLIGLCFFFHWYTFLYLFQMSPIIFFSSSWKWKKKQQQQNFNMVRNGNFQIDSKNKCYMYSHSFYL